MKPSGIYLLVYDIGSDRVRDRVSHTAAGYGVRVQKSVFECRLTKSLKRRLWESLGKFALAEDDRIALYPLAAASANHKGVVEDAPLSESHHAVVL